MILTGVILLIVAAFILVIAILLCLGHINLLQEYHYTDTKKEDRTKLSLAVGLSLLPFVIGFLAAGLIAIITQNDSLLPLIIILEFGSIIISVILTIVFIRKYNKKFIS